MRERHDSYGLSHARAAAARATRTDNAAPDPKVRPPARSAFSAIGDTILFFQLTRRGLLG